MAFRFAKSALVRTATVAVIAMTAALLAGCVTPIALDKESPDLSYKFAQPTAVAVIDDRDTLHDGKPPTFIGRAHSVFGIPSDMETYPWLITDKTKRGQTLAQALEDRIVVGLNDEGWQVAPVVLDSLPEVPDAAAVLRTNGSQRLVVLTLKRWFVSVNLNWVGAFNFDWGYRLVVYDPQGKMLVDIADAGRDVVDMQASESPQNMIKMAFRARLIKILERPELMTSLQP